LQLFCRCGIEQVHIIFLYDETVIFLNFRNELQNLWSFTSFLLASILNAFFFAWLN